MRYPRFSLRTLLIGIAVVGVPIGWIAHQHDWIHKRAEFTANLNGFNTLLSSVNRPAPWSLRLFGETGFGREKLLVDNSSLDTARTLFPEVDSDSIIDLDSAAGLELVLGFFLETSLRSGREHHDAFRDYVEGIKDRERLKVLARKLKSRLEKGLPDFTPILWRCAETIAKPEDDELIDEFMPLVKSPNLAVAVWVTEAFSQEPYGYISNVLLEGLRSERTEVAKAAIDRSTHKRNQPRVDELHRLLTMHLKGSNDILRRHAAFTLMHTFEDDGAHQYLLTEMKSPDSERALAAMGWLGDSCNWNRAPPPNLLETFQPFLKSPDKQRRQLAVKVVGVYAGESIIRELIEHLSDDDPANVEAASYGLLFRVNDDFKLARRLITEATTEHPNEKIRAKCQDLMTKPSLFPMH